MGERQAETDTDKQREDRMGLTRNGNAEEVAMLLANVLHQVQRTGEAPLSCLPLILASGRVWCRYSSVGERWGQNVEQGSRVAQAGACMHVCACM